MNDEIQVPPGSHPDESKWDLVQELADVEAQIQQAEAVRKKINRVAGALRDQAHRQVIRMEETGLREPDNQEAYRQALEDRRTCEIVLGMSMN